MQIMSSSLKMVMASSHWILQNIEKTMGSPTTPCGPSGAPINALFVATPSSLKMMDDGHREMDTIQWPVLLQ